MGFKDDVRAMGAELERRVTDLEVLAEQIKRERGGVTASALPTRQVPTSVRVGSYDGVTGSSRPSAVTPDVDYGAVAFGLSEIKRKVASALPGNAYLGGEYEGTVQYFADVFAKSDPSFNEADFKRQAGV